MSVQTPFQRLFASTAHVTTTATDTHAAEGTGLRLSWPELTLDAPFRNAASTSGQLLPLTNAVATLDHSVLCCLFSLSTAQRRGLWLALLSTGLAVSAYVSYACVWPRVKQGVDAYVWDTWLAPSMPSVSTAVTRTGGGDGATDAAASSPPPPPPADSDGGGGNVPPLPTASDNHDPRVRATSPSADSDAHRRSPCATTTSSTLSISLPSVFQRALDAVRSHQLTTKAATATTVLLERQDHQWFATLREHVGAGAAIVGVSVRVPATLLLAPTDEVVTLNRWLEVDVRRAPPSDSPVCLWSNDVGDTSNTDVDSGDAHPADDAAAAPPDGLHLSALLRDVVGHQFERQRQPLPALQYRVHNQLCAPEHATRYGLEVATVVAGVVCGCALAAPAAESPLATHASLTSWATSDVGPRCEREWEVYAGERAAAMAADRTDSPSLPDSPSPAPPSRDETARSPLAIQSRIAAALWESESDEEDEAGNSDTYDDAREGAAPEDDPTLTTVPLADDDADDTDDAPVPPPVHDDAAIPVTVPSPAAQPIVVCGQLRWAPKTDTTVDEMDRVVDRSATGWPADAIAQTLAQHLNEVLRPTSADSSRPTVHVNAEGELYVLSHAPIGLTVKQLLVQACEAHGCALQLHCLARVYRTGTAATCKVRQTWVSSVELV
jgi:hypothetical protein